MYCTVLYCNVLYQSDGRMDGLKLILRLCSRHKLLALSRIEPRFPGDPLRVVVAAVTGLRTPSYCGVLICFWYGAQLSLYMLGSHVAAGRYSSTHS